MLEVKIYAPRVFLERIYYFYLYFIPSATSCCHSVYNSWTWSTRQVKGKLQVN